MLFRSVCLVSTLELYGINMKYLFIIAFVLLIVICGPLATIWSLNTLFSLSIPYEFDTWAAALILTGAVTARTKRD